MTHDDMIDAIRYSIGAHEEPDIPDYWKRRYLNQWNTDWKFESPSQILSTLQNKEKENKTMATARERMNTFKKGMLVECIGHHNNDRGYIEAFDYAHMLVGVRMVGAPSYKNLLWTNPNYLRIVALPDGKAVPTLNGPCPKPKRVVYDEEAGVTVVLWEDGQKTVVRATEGEQMDVYDAFCAAYCKRVYGTNSALKRELNKILTVNHPKEPEPEHITMTESFQKLNDGIKKLKDALNGKSDD